MSARPPLSTNPLARRHRRLYSYTCIQYNSSRQRGKHMPRPNPLTQGLEQQPQPVRASAARRQPTHLKAVPPSRTGRVLIGGHFAPEVQTALKVIAAEERTTMQA